MKNRTVLTVAVVTMLLLAAGLSPDQVVAELTDLEPADVTACLRYASQRAAVPEPVSSTRIPGCT